MYEMEPSFSFKTPEISGGPCLKVLDDSGYLSTPDSAGLSWDRGSISVSHLSNSGDRYARRAYPLLRKCGDLSEESPPLYMPEVTNDVVGVYKSKRIALRRYKSLPISGELSQVINYIQPESFTKLNYTFEERMNVEEELQDTDDELINDEHQANKVHTEPGNCSLYEDLDMSCDGFETSYMDLNEVVPGSFSLQDLKVDLNKVRSQNMLSAEHSLRSSQAHAKKRQFCDDGAQLAYINWQNKEHKPVFPVTTSGFEWSPMSAGKRQISNDAAPPIYRNWRENLSMKNGSKILSDFSSKSTVDFLHYLGVASNHSTIVSRILSHLSRNDLVAARQVNASWRRIIMSDKPSRRRLVIPRPVILTPEKENTMKKVEKGDDNAARAAAAVALRAIDNMREHPRTPPKVPPFSLANAFYACSRDMEVGYRHDRCAKCNGRAVVHIVSDIGRCTSPCKYVYCARCKAADHRPAPCVCVGDLGGWDAADVRKARICSKNSKRRLLRL